MLFEQILQHLLLSDLEFTGVDGGVVDTQDGVDVFHTLGLDVCELLDLGGSVLDLLVGHVEVELFHSRLDGVPSCQSMTDRDVSGHAEIRRVEDLVCGRVGEDRLGMDTCLVGECAESGNVVVERDGNLDGLGDEVFNLSEHGQLVLGLYVFRVGDHHSGDQTAERGDTVSLSDTENRGIDVGGTGLERGVGVGDGASGVVVEVAFNVTRDDATEGSDEVVYLSRVGASDGIGDTDSVQSDLVDGSVNGEQVDEL